jgi:hypothetical protein
MIVLPSFVDVGFYGKKPTHSLLGKCVEGLRKAVE